MQKARLEDKPGLEVCRWIERYYNLKQRRYHAAGGHYGAWEEPDAITTDVRDFFRALD